MSIPTWSAGAHSILPLPAAGWFSFRVPMGAVGAAVGLSPRDMSVSPNETMWGLRFGSGRFQVVEGGATRTASAAYATTEVFHIARVGTTVYYCRGDVPELLPGTSLKLPGAVIYTSNARIGRDTPMYLDAALLSGGDSVLDASMTEIQGYVWASFKAMKARASMATYNGVYAEFPPMRASGGIGNGVSVSFEPMAAAASQAAVNRVAVSMLPMTAAAFNLPEALNGVLVTMAPMYVESGGPGSTNNRVVARLRSMGAFASQAAYFGAYARMIPMQVLALGGPGITGPRADATLPAVTGLVEAATVVEVEDVFTVADSIPYRGAARTLDEFLVVGETTESTTWNMLVDGLTVGDQAIVPNPALMIEDGFILLDAAVVPPPPTQRVVDESFRLLGSADFVGDWTMIEDGFKVRDEAVQRTVHATVMLADSFRLLERVRIGVGRVFDSTLRLGDQVVTSSARTVADGFTVIDDTARETITPPTTRTVEEGLRLGGEVYQVSNVTVESGLRVLDGASIHVQLQLSDGFTVGDGVEVSAEEPLRMVEERLAIGDATQVQIITEAMVEEGFRVRDRALVAGQGLMAWVLNTETAGVSWYENWAFQDMAQIGDQVLAVGPDGLAVLGDDCDEGIDIEAQLALGYTDFGGYDSAGVPKNESFLKKHLVALWFGYRAEGMLDAHIQTYEAQFTYRLEPQPARELINGRIKPGKGLNERFYRITLGNPGGAAFEVNSIAAEVVPSKQRRI